MHIRLLSLFMMMFLSQVVFGQAQSPIPLYPDGVPNSKPTPAAYIEKNDKGSLTKVSIPMITPYLPEKANGCAVIIFPGGGYVHLATEHEGKAIALEFNKIGVTAFVVKYRLPSDNIMMDKTIGPLQDAQRAIQMVRQGAATWGVDPKRIGIIGFSAGGHLASTAGTHFDKVVIDNKDNISVRPDFMMLIYPVISFGEKAHVGSKENLIGKNAPQAQIDLYSNEKQVTANTPPTFLVHAEDDNTVPVQNALLMYQALLNAKVKAEMHLFQAGGHGFGLKNPTSKELWFNWAKDWMDANGWLANGKI
ncbi:alpha/beta hydrolase [Mucilaginibacter sp.]|jgi:acetyl esterase/lipase|uniref:alpha/beta hydrolase n=1 Tax=Mucilaginibacter sp. TaxID=1882438 RepID=UPI0035658546